MAHKSVGGNSIKYDWESLKGSVTYAKQGIEKYAVFAKTTLSEVEAAMRRLDSKWPGRLRVARAKDELKSFLTSAEQAVAEAELQLKSVDERWPGRPRVVQAREILRILVARAKETTARVEFELENVHKKWLRYPPTSEPAFTGFSDQHQTKAESVKARLRIEDLSSDSELSEVPEDIGPDPFSDDIQAEDRLESSVEESYEKDRENLQELLARAKRALETASFVREVETAAELELALEDFAKKWPGRLPGLSAVSNDHTHELELDLSSRGDDTDTSLSSEDALETADEDTDFPCPYASVYYCDMTFELETAAIIHSTVHTANSGEFLCPHAGSYNCTSTFSRLEHAKRHGDSAHLKIRRFPCPYAAEYDCSKAFTRKDIAKSHGRTHTGEKPNLCPYAAIFKRSKRFSRVGHARRYGKTHIGTDGKCEKDDTAPSDCG